MSSCSRQASGISSSQDPPRSATPLLMAPRRVGPFHRRPPLPTRTRPWPLLESPGGVAVIHRRPPLPIGNKPPWFQPPGGVGLFDRRLSDTTAPDALQLRRDVGKPETTGLSHLIATSADALGLTAPSCTACTLVDPDGSGSGHPVGTSKAPRRPSEAQSCRARAPILLTLVRWRWMRRR